MDTGGVAVVGAVLLAAQTDIIHACAEQSVSGTDCPGQNCILLARDTMTRCSLPCKRRADASEIKLRINMRSVGWYFGTLNKVQMGKMEQILAVMCTCLKYV